MDNIQTIIATIFILLGAIHIGRNISVLFPRAHMDGETKDAVKLGLALITTLAAFVLGLLVSSGKSAFENQTTAVSEMVSEAATFDEMLVHYGNGSENVLTDFRSASKRMILSLWDESFETQEFQIKEALKTSNEKFINDVALLPASDDRSRFFKDSALASATSLIKARFRLATLQHSVIPLPMVMTIVLWLACIFIIFGFCSPGNMTAMVSEYVGAFCATAAIFLIVELDHPFTGLIQISRTPASDLIQKLLSSACMYFECPPAKSSD